MHAWGGLGITAGAHRLWAHRTYKAKLPLRIFLGIGQTVALQVCFFHLNSSFILLIIYLKWFRTLFLSGVEIIVFIISIPKHMPIRIMLKEASFSRIWVKFWAFLFRVYFNFVIDVLIFRLAINEKAPVGYWKRQKNSIRWFARWSCCFLAKKVLC